MATTKKAAPLKKAAPKKTATTAKAAPQIAPRRSASKPQPGSDPEHPTYTVSKTVLEMSDDVKKVFDNFSKAMLKAAEAFSEAAKVMNAMKVPAPTATAMQAAPVQQPAPQQQATAPTATVQQPVNQQPAATTTGAPTLTQLREAINAYVTTDERGQKLMQVLSKYGASSASTLAEENYAAFFNDIKALA